MAYSYYFKSKRNDTGIIKYELSFKHLLSLKWQRQGKEKQEYLPINVVALLIELKEKVT